MKIALTEIWNFLSLIENPEKDRWNYSLMAGDVMINNIHTDIMLQLEKDTSFDTELLPSIFTFREILWQPDVFTEVSMSLPSLRVLRAYCADLIVELEDNETATTTIYIPLLKGLGKCTIKAINELDADKPDVRKVLGTFRTSTFPIIKFFIFHPMNRPDYLADAINRLNYAVKIMLTEFNGKYTSLEDPYWLVNYEEVKTLKKLENQESEQ